MKVWVLSFVNVNGRSWTELYSTREKACAILNCWIDENMTKEGFIEFHDWVTWINPENNFESSRIYISERTVF